MRCLRYFTGSWLVVTFCITGCHRELVDDLKGGMNLPKHDKGAGFWQIFMLVSFNGRFNKRIMIRNNFHNMILKFVLLTRQMFMGHKKKGRLESLIFRIRVWYTPLSLLFGHLRGGLP